MRSGCQVQLETQIMNIIIVDDFIHWYLVSIFAALGINLMYVHVPEAKAVHRWLFLIRFQPHFPSCSVRMQQYVGVNKSLRISRICQKQYKSLPFY